MKYKILDITAVNVIQGKTKQTDNTEKYKQKQKETTFMQCTQKTNS